MHNHFINTAARNNAKSLKLGVEFYKSAERLTTALLGV